jgi:hypothetical protein
LRPSAFTVSKYWVSTREKTVACTDIPSTELRARGKLSLEPKGMWREIWLQSLVSAFSYLLPALSDQPSRFLIPTEDSLVRAGAPALLTLREIVLDTLTPGTLYIQSANKIILGQIFACETATANRSWSVYWLKSASRYTTIRYPTAYPKFSSKPTSAKDT